jgi:uncharacterized protein YeeX (DUF496 family)
MSLAEIKAAIDDLPEEEQLRLRDYLHRKMELSAERKARLSRAMREMDEEKKFTREQIEELCRRLELNGL